MDGEFWNIDDITIYPRPVQKKVPISVAVFKTQQTFDFAVANGYGIGLSVAIPKSKHKPQVRHLPLEDFPSVTFGVFWHGKPRPITQAFLSTIQQTAQLLMKVDS